MRDALKGFDHELDTLFIIVRIIGRVYLVGRKDKNGHDGMLTRFCETP